MTWGIFSFHQISKDGFTRGRARARAVTQKEVRK